MDLALAIAQGFHNAPRLYGDNTVRRPTRISGYRSGLRAAGEEFAFGVYDGVTGLVLQPYHGAKDGGAFGFVQGVGKGIGGFVLKDLAAIFGPIGYTMKGVHKELIKGKQPTAFIRKARIIQGEKDVRTLDEKEVVVRERVDAAWLAIMEIKKEFDEIKKEGLVERIALARESRRLKKQGGFESVGKAQKAMKKWESKRKHTHHDQEQFHENGNSLNVEEQAQENGIVTNGITSHSAAKQEHHAKKEVHHARAVADENHQNVEAPPPPCSRFAATNHITTADKNKLKAKGVVAEDFAPETPMPGKESERPVDLGQHIEGGEDLETLETKRGHSKSLPAHGGVLGGL